MQSDIEAVYRNYARCQVADVCINWIWDRAQVGAADNDPVVTVTLESANEDHKAESNFPQNCL